MSETWYGWGRRRKGGRWARLVGPCGSMGECSRLLGEEGRRRGIKDSDLMMTTGRRPDDLLARDPGQGSSGER
jgi:hypothetical protein